MDMLQRVREIGRSAEISQSGIDGARRKLHAAQREARTTRPRRSAFVVIGLVGGVAALATGAVIVPQLMQPESPVAVDTPTPSSPSTSTPQPSASPEPTTPRSVLASVAREVRINEAPAPMPGQYLKIETVSQRLTYYADGVGVNPMEIGRSEADGGWLAEHRSTTYIPADLSGEWLTQPEEPVVLQEFGTGVAPYLEEWLTLYSTDPSEWRELGGPRDNWPDASGDPLATYFARLPADPDALIELFTPQDDVTDPQKVGWVLTHLLSYNVGSAELRAAMYEALSTLPGTQIVDIDGTQATLVFHTRPGHAPDPIGERWQSITIDLNTGVVLSTTDRGAGSSTLIADELPDDRTDYTVSVVDEIP